VLPACTAVFYISSLACKYSVVASQISKFPSYETLFVLDRSLFAKKCSSAGITRWAGRDDAKETTSLTLVLF
jgi:hypothetical protein